MNRREFVLSSSAVIASAIAWSDLKALAGFELGTMRTKQHLLFGVDYYPDQTPERLWEQDAEEMAATGITNVRMAEFAWALMEPEENSYKFDWLLRSIGILHKHGIAVILGTPSAAPPPWLSQKYPEILMVNEHGMTLSPGARRFTCPTNATYRELSVGIATKMAAAAGHAAGVIGWQIDNELTLGSSARCYCKYCRAGFEEWLRGRYGSLANLNEKWGTVFWSNTYSDFSQIPVPLPSGAPPNPGWALDYDRYQTVANVGFLQRQLDVLRKMCPDQFITTNNVGGLVDNIDMRELYRNLDFVAADNYPGFFATQMGNSGHKGGSAAEGVATAVGFAHDYMRSVKGGEPFMVMEEQTGKAGQPTFSPQPEPGQLRLWSYQAMAHGAMGINYFRWDTARSGAEEYWHGMLRYDRTPSPGFDEIRATIGELKALGEAALHARYKAEIALCYDSDADWALTIQPGQPELKYVSEMMMWHGALAASQAGVDIVDAKQDLSKYKVLCAPTMYIVSRGQAERIRSFVKQGGTFIAGIRLGVKDEYSRIVGTPLPGLLRDVMGCEVYDYEPIYGLKRGVGFSGMLAGPKAECQIWADILKPDSAETLATYADGQYVGRAAITLNRYGKGKAIYVGCHLDAPELGRVLLTLLGAAGVQLKHEAAAGVEITSRESAGQSWTYILNHTGKAQSIRLGGTYRELSGGGPVSGSLELPAYGVKVLAG
ncbi:MAG TPA: beta-galactosidase [Acidobacteriaceae bacterium]|nr:beta-galactosidase [Acidobacteriaceae bacterium]